MSKRKTLLCYGPFCYQKRTKHKRNTLVTDRINHKHYCFKCHHYIKAKRANRYRLYKYIQRQARIAYPTPIMRRDLKKLRKFHYTYGGILNALKYANAHSLKFSFRGQFFLRYVPYVYEQAQKWQYKQDHHNDLTIDLHPTNNQIQEATVNSSNFDESKRDPHYQIDQSILN